MILCPTCFDPTQDGLACAVCTSKLRKALTDLPDLLRELRVTLTRQDKISKASGRRSSGIPLAFSYNASWTHEAVVGTIGLWIKQIAGSHGESLERRERICTCKPYRACRFDTIRVTWIPGNTMTSWCAWLLERIPRIRGHVIVTQIYDELMSIVRAVKHSIDRPADRDFVATCSICGKGVYCNSETPADAWVGCSECRKVAERDEATGEITGFVPEYQRNTEDQRRLSALRNACVVERDIVVALRALLHVDYDRRQVWSWINRYEAGVSLRRAVLQPSEFQEDGTPLYRVEDALRLAAMVPARRFGKNRDAG